ncbi:MAG: methyltransferase domain-containing protein [Rhodospirillaceae bacterium]|nr:methyltransferase domain-containing protein [Rhodospirillaceae bacterium]
MPGVLPPTYDRVGRHGVSPELSHDEIARFNFLTNLNVHLGQAVFPATKLAFEKRVRPAFQHTQGRDFASQREIRDAMKADPVYQAWAALRRNTMEMRQQAGRHVVMRQLGPLNDKVAALNSGKATLKLDDAMRAPDYIAQVDNHWMPGSYYTETVPGDASAGASYEVGTFVTTAGSMSASGDGGGRALVNFVRARFPNFRPKRILDLGAGIGVNTLPLAGAFPEAEVIAADVAAPMLRYGHARAQSLGYTNVRFVQMDADHLDLAPQSFDWVQTTMMLHETSAATVATVMRRAFDLLKPGGLMLHVEQPNFTPQMTLWERFTRDWDSWYNNEPFWGKLHTMDVFALMTAAGFARDKQFETFTEADIEPGRYQPWASTLSRHKPELNKTGAANDGARKGEHWYLFGATK